MRVALCSDVHGNLPALQGICSHARRLGVQDFWNLGDHLGYGPFPSEVLSFLRKHSFLALRGNYDTKVLDLPHKGEKWLQGKIPEKAVAFRHARESLTQENLAYLQGLPETLRLRYGGKSFLLCHGSPESPEEHLHENTPEKRFKELGKLAGTDCVLCGHSHVPFHKVVEGVHFINPGSVGRPEDGDPRSSYGILTINGHGVNVAFHRVGYDVDRVLYGLECQGLPEAFGAMFRRGRSLNDVLGRAWEHQKKGSPVNDTILDILEEYVDCREHCQTVASLAMALYDELQELHAFGKEERKLLQYAAFLHDIGWCEGRQGHHKTSQKLIMDIPELPFSPRQRRMVAAIARYHRRALPREEHRLFSRLGEEEKEVVSALGGILRIADGLDCSHLGLVEEISCALEPRRVVITCVAEQPPYGEDEKAQKKADLFEKHFEKEVSIEWILKR